MLVGVSGLAYAGKDTVAGILVEHHGFKQYALGTKVKESALALDPWIPIYDPGAPMHLMGTPRWVRLSQLIAEVGPEEAKKNPEVRRTYQRLATEAGRKTLWEDMWTRKLFELIRDQRPKNAVISDVRFLNEAQYITAKGGFMVRVIRPGAGLEGDFGDHVSETELSDDTDGIYDEILYNDGTLQDLETKVARTLAQLTNTALASTRK